MGKVGGSSNSPVDSTLYEGGNNDNHGSNLGTQVFRPRNYEGYDFTVHVAPGDYEDLLLGIRLAPSAPNACLDVVWQLATTWTVQIHPVP